jgi:hypothetical protein
MCNCNTFILVIVSLPFTINVINLTIPSFIPWFRILSQYGVGIVLLLHFVSVIQYPSQFQMNANIPLDDVGIAFKFHNFVQVDILTSM